jgi:hypothetical protein
MKRIAMLLFGLALSVPAFASGDYQHYRCKDCGLVWEEELPQ